MIELCLQHASEQLSAARAGKLTPSALHDLRIACRRAEAGLRLCRDAAESRAWDWLKRQLKLLRHACNPARDDDMLCKWLRRHEPPSGTSLQSAIRAHRRKAQPKIIELAKWLSRHQRFDQRSAKVVAKLRACQCAENVAQSFGKRFLDDVLRFVQALPANRDDLAALHRLRISGKRMRYAGELLMAIWPEFQFAELHEHLHALQDRLGAIHDQVVGARRLSDGPSRKTARSAKKLAAAAQTSAARLQGKFWRWWQACPLERMLADATAEALMLMRAKS